MPAGAASVFIVDDHAFFRAGLRSLLTEHGYQVVGEAASGEEALALVERRRPDVVVMDMSMPGMSGAETTRLLSERVPGAVVVMVTVSAGAADVLDALEAGAAGYLLKDSTPEETVRAIEAARNGETPLSPRVAGLIVERARSGGGDADPAAARLSERELDVLRLLAEGLDNNEIALRLYLSPTTVKRHVSAIFSKLGVQNRVQAAIWAVRAGLI